LTWSNTRTIKSVFFDTCSGSSCPVGATTLSTATLSYWDGAAWATITTVTGKTDDWSYVLPNAITTNKLRVTIPAGAPPAEIREWQVQSC
jgi:hypothetical protein